MSANQTNKNAAKKAATKSIPAAKKAATKQASKAATPGQAPKPNPTTPPAAAKILEETSQRVNAHASVVSTPLKGIRPIAHRQGLDAKFQVFRGKHIFCGEDHIGWLMPGTNKAVLRTAFESFADWVKVKAQQVEGRSIGLIQLSDERPIFNVEDSAGKVCPRDIISNADPALGDLDEKVIAWHRDNLSHEDFVHKYDGRLDMARLGPQKPPGVGKLVTAEDLKGLDVAGAQQAQKPGKDGFTDRDPTDAELAELNRAPGLEGLDDGRENNNLTEEELLREDIDNAGGGGEDNDGFLDEDPEP